MRPNSTMNCENQQCLTLDQYTKEKEGYFKDGTTFLFLEGNHSSLIQVNLSGISHVTLRSKESNSHVYIMCSNKVTFRCENVTDFNVKGLTFLFRSSEYNPASVLAIRSSKMVTISKSVFQGSVNLHNTSAWAVFSQNSSVAIADCLFEGNTGGKGGAILVQGGSTLEATSLETKLLFQEVLSMYQKALLS